MNGNSPMTMLDNRVYRHWLLPGAVPKLRLVLLCTVTNVTVVIPSRRESGQNRDVPATVPVVRPRSRTAGRDSPPDPGPHHQTRAQAAAVTWQVPDGRKGARRSTGSRWSTGSDTRFRVLSLLAAGRAGHMGRVPRRLRIRYHGAIDHVMSRGNGRQHIAHNDDDRSRLRHDLALAVSRCSCKVDAFVLLSNHLHLVFKTPEPNLARGMQSFQIPTVQLEYAGSDNPP